jgi:hypothetical protein
VASFQDCSHLVKVVLPPLHIDGAHLLPGQVAGSASGSKSTGTCFFLAPEAWFSPERKLSIPTAARSPSADGGDHGIGPVGRIAAGKEHGTEVAPVTGSNGEEAARVELQLDVAEEACCGSIRWPIATITWSAGIS